MTSATALAKLGCWLRRMEAANKRASPLKASDSERTDRSHNTTGVVVAKAKMTRNAAIRRHPLGKSVPTVQASIPQATTEMTV